MKQSSKILLLVGFAGLILVTRTIPHMANWSPALALLMLCGWVTPQRSLGLVVALGAMALSDSLLGSYPGMTFNYLAYAGLIGIGQLLRPHWRSFAGAGLAGGLIFFTLSNFGVWWASGLYPATFDGLLLCYTKALPFFRATLVSTLVPMLVAGGLAQWLLGEQAQAAEASQSI